MREKQPRLLTISSKYDPSFDLSEPEVYRRDVPKAGSRSTPKAGDSAALICES
jgi:hypothetical protein